MTPALQAWPRDLTAEEQQELDSMWRTRTAHHEAGHAVVAWATWVAAGRPDPNDGPWGSVTIVPDGDRAGCVTGVWTAWRGQSLESDAILVAGMVAECLVEVEGLSDGMDADWFADAAMDPGYEWNTTSDFRTFRWKCSGRQSRRTRERRILRAATLANVLLVEHRTLWLGLTQALLDRGVLYWTDVTDICGPVRPRPVHLKRRSASPKEVPTRVRPRSTGWRS